MKYLNSTINITLALVVVLNSFTGLLENNMATLLGAITAGVALYMRYKISKNPESVGKVGKITTHLITAFIVGFFLLGILTTLILLVLQ